MPNLPQQPRPPSKQTIRKAWANERTTARRVRTAGDSARTHIAMLGYEIRHRDRHEIAGQLVRFLATGPGSASRRYPLGNTGGADVNAVMPMAIPTDLQAFLDGTVSSSS